MLKVSSQVCTWAVWKQLFCRAERTDNLLPLSLPRFSQKLHLSSGFCTWSLPEQHCSYVVRITVPSWSWTLDLTWGSAPSLWSCLVVWAVGGPGYHHQTCSACLLGVPWGCIPFRWRHGPFGTPATPGSLLPAPCLCSASCPTAPWCTLGFECLIFSVCLSKEIFEVAEENF